MKDCGIDTKDLLEYMNKKKIEYWDKHEGNDSDICETIADAINHMMIAVEENQSLINQDGIDLFIKSCKDGKIIPSYPQKLLSFHGMLYNSTINDILNWVSEYKKE